MPRARREVPWLETRDGTYYVFWYDAARKRTDRLSLRTADSMEAQKRYAAFLVDGRAVFDNEDTGRSVGLTVTQALDDYRREHVATKVIAQRRQETAIDHLKAWFKSAVLHEIDIPACRGYADARRAGWPIPTARTPRVGPQSRR